MPPTPLHIRAALNGSQAGERELAQVAWLRHPLRQAFAPLRFVGMFLCSGMEWSKWPTGVCAPRGEGLHHIKEKVDDIPRAIEEFKKKGIEVIQSGKCDRDEFYYLDTESLLGFYYEIGNYGWVRGPDARYPPEEEKSRS